MKEPESLLHEMLTEACKQPPGSPDRQRHLTRIIRVIYPKLWKDNTPYYEDALQQTWLYFCQNICEATTTSKYDPTRSHITTWLNIYLKRRIQDLYEDIQDQEKKGMKMRGSLSDRAIAELLGKLAQFKPRTIGLDIYRDFSVDTNQADLATRLKRDRHLFGVCKMSSPEDGDSKGVQPQVKSHDNAWALVISFKTMMMFCVVIFYITGLLLTLPVLPAMPSA